MKELPGINLIWHSIRPQGGMDRHVLDLINGFSLRGVPVRVIARTVAWPGSQPDNVEFVVLPDRTPFQRFNNNRFDHKAYGYIKDGWPVIGISRVTGGPVDLSVSGGTHLAHLIDKGKKKPGYFDKQVIANEKTLYTNSRIIVTHSRRVHDEIVRDYQIDPAKIHVLYPPVDTGFFNMTLQRERDRIRESLGVGKDQFLLLFPSNNHELKGADLILKALEKQDTSFVLAVAGKKELKHPKVLNLGFRQDMPALYTAADATILASKYEAFGLVGPESISCGTPVLFSDTIGAAEVLSEPGCYRFKRSVEDLGELLDRMGERFRTGKLRVESPAKCIHYPYRFDEYLDELISLIQS